MATIPPRSRGARLRSACRVAVLAPALAGGAAAAPGDVIPGREQHPLLTLAMRVAEPRRVVVIGTERGTTDVILATGGTEDVVGLFASEGDPRDALAGTAPADLVVLLSPHTGDGAHVSASAGEGSLYTREAFAEIWNRVAPDGWLAWIAGDELVFLRGIVAAWHATGGPAGRPIGLDSWGFRLKKEAVADSSYRFVLLLPRSPDSVPVRSVLRTAQRTPLQDLFGPGTDIKSRFVPLAGEDDPASARQLLREQFGGRFGRAVVVDAATDDGPPIFDVSAARPPAENGVLAAGAFALLAVLLLPLGARRHVDTPQASRDVPLPLRLAELPFAAALAGVGIALAWRAVTFRPGGELALALLPLAALAGGALSRLVRPVSALATMPILGAVVSVALALGVETLAPPLRMVLGAVVAAVFGLAAGSQLRAVRADTDDAVFRWAVVAAGIALLASLSLASRLVHDLGTRDSAVVLASGWILAFVARLVLPRLRGPGSRTS